MTSKVSRKIWVALDEAGATGATAAQLAATACVSVDEVRMYVKNRIARETKVLVGLLQKGSQQQVYALVKHAQAEGPARKPPKPAKPKAAPPAAPAGPREAPVCSGTMGKIKEGELGVIPRMTCARPGADDHLAAQSRRGSEFVPHRPPLHMCSPQK